MLVAASLHLASTLPAPRRGLLREPFALRDGRLAVPAGPGLGVELDEELVARLAYV